MAQNDIAMTAIETDDSVSHPREAATRTGEMNHPTVNRHQADTAIHTTSSAAQVVEEQREISFIQKNLGSFQCGRTQDTRFTVIPRIKSLT